MSYFINSKAGVNFPDFEHLGFFRFAGSVLAKALFEKIPVLPRLSKALLCTLVTPFLDKSSKSHQDNGYTIDDLKDLDYQIYKSVAYIVQDPTLDEDTLNEFNFTVLNHKGEEVELIEDGADTKVCMANRQLYGTLVARYYLYDEVKDELRAFIEGFHDVIPPEVIAIFDTDELDLIMGGIPLIDVEDWRAHTEYGGRFHSKHQVISWFWEILLKLS